MFFMQQVSYFIAIHLSDLMDMREKLRVVWSWVDI